MFLILKVAQKTFYAHHKTMHKYLILLILIIGLNPYRTIQAQQPPPNGRYKELFPSGKVHIKGHYKNGQKEGNWFYYNEKQVMIKQERYKGGLLKQTRTFNEKGKLIAVTDENGNTREVPCNCH